MTAAKGSDRARRALSELRVERERLDDGRQVLYFSWPEAGASDAEAGDAQAAVDRAERPDV